MKKRVAGVLGGLATALRYREDVGEAAAVEAARDAEAALLATWKVRAWDEMAARCEAGEEAAERLRPTPPMAGWRENVEVLVVAISLALACKCYFVQPFKIPTGSMQPTLNGILAKPQEGKAWSDQFPANLVKIALFGEYYQEVRAKADGMVTGIHRWKDQEAIWAGGVAHPVRLTFLPGGGLDEARSMKLFVKPGDRVKKGDVLASGLVRRGDQVLVNKVKYHFSRPKRGDIIVFSTDEIPGRERWNIPEGTFYIKRLAGLSGERIALRGRELVADGEAVREPAAFRRMREDSAYNGGYVPLPGTLLANEASELEVGEGKFLPLGDNTFSSQDGRFFGPVDEAALVGPAFGVYWPFGGHWGGVE